MTQSAEILARRLAAIVESSDDAIISKDLHGTITSWNRAAEMMFGFTAEEQIGRSILTIIPPDREGEERTVISKIKRGEIVDHYETVRRRKDGSVFDISLTISPIRDESGTIVGASKIARDITERQRAAQAIADARLDAEEANRLKDEFLATLSHELRTPLNALVGYTRMLRDGQITGDQQARAFLILERNASLLTRLVDDMLDVSAIISGKTKLNMRPVVLSQLIDQAVAMIAPTAGAKGVAVKTDVDRFVAPLTADPDRLHQVLWNLLANAVKFTPRGGTVKVALESSGDFVEIVVEDSGSGISASFLPYVFDRFRQSEREAAGRLGGLGLGLAISRHIVELHGGTIAAASAGEDKGATFRILLPYNVVVPAPRDGAPYPV
jgi:PAS domain S-box-containing protein